MQSAIAAQATILEQKESSGVACHHLQGRGGVVSWPNYNYKCHQPMNESWIEKGFILY